MNIIWLGYDFGVRTVLAWGCNSYFHPLIWTLVSILVYTVRALAMRTRLQWKKTDTPAPGPDGVSLPSSSPATSSPAHVQQQAACITWKSKTLVWVILEPLASIACVLTLTYGTYIFSPSSFVGSVDALLLVARILLSAIVSRIIVATELSKLRNVERLDMSEE